MSNRNESKAIVQHKVNNKNAEKSNQNQSNNNQRSVTRKNLSELSNESQIANSSGNTNSFPYLGEQFSDVSQVFKTFEQHMQNMHQEMNRFWNNIFTFPSDFNRLGGNNSLHIGGPDQNNILDLNSSRRINREIIQDNNGKKILKMTFDVSQYNPKDVIIKTENNRLIVQAKYHQKNDNSQIFRMQSQQYLLPNGVDPDSVKLSLKNDGILNVEAPLPENYVEPGYKYLPV